MKEFEEKKDIEKQEELKEIITKRFFQNYGVNITDMGTDILQFILDNILVIRHQKIIFHRNKSELEENVFNGYTRELTNNSDLIRRRIVTKLIGTEKIKIGYHRDKKIIKNTEVLESGLIVIREIVYTTGIRKNDAIYSDTYKLHIYYGGE